MEMEETSMNRLIISLILACFLILGLHAMVFCQGAVDRDLASLRKVVKYQTSTKGRSTGVMTDSTVDYAINRAVIQVCAKYPAINKFDTIVTTAGTSVYALNSDFDRIRIVYLIAPDSVISLQPKEVDSMASMFSILKTGTPGYYYTSGGYITLLPPPTNEDGDSILIDYFAQDAMLSATTDSTVIRTKYLEKVVEYACMILSGTRHDWQSATFYQTTFKDMPIPFEEIMKLK